LANAGCARIAIVRVSLAATAICVGLLCSSAARANPVRLHGTGAAARALDEYQNDEFGWGAGLMGAVELGLSRQLGLELQLGGLWLSEGDDPSDPSFSPKDAGTAGTAAAGLRYRPFATSYAGRPVSAAGLWLAANGGAALTGGLVRPMMDAQLGFDFLYAKGRMGIGPMLGYLHVFQPDSEFRPEDANIALVGIHVMFDSEGAAEPTDGDADRDGIADSADRCPRIPEDKDGFEDQDGCPETDNDGDGILDGVDQCPNEPEDKDGFEDEDGCPEEDNDKDGLVDAKDKCPNDPEDKDGFEDEDGCPEKDNDRDGLADSEDHCPNEAENKNNYADEDGCPDEAQVRVLGDKILLDDRVHFRTNNATIRMISYPLLSRLAKLINEHPEYVHIDIEGHADERGPEAYNQRLSEDRAKSVLEFLVKHGVDRSRLSSKGFGKSQPLVEKRSEYAWLLNRRVEFRVTRRVKYTGAAPPPLPAPDKKVSEKDSDVAAAAEEENIPTPQGGAPHKKGAPAPKKEPENKPSPEKQPAPKEVRPGDGAAAPAKPGGTR
jgi:outer membrane protein OmpA-like peptidoglycan-associated protein